MRYVGKEESTSAEDLKIHFRGTNHTKFEERIGAGRYGLMTVETHNMVHSREYLFNEGKSQIIPFCILFQMHKK